MIKQKLQGIWEFIRGMRDYIGWGLLVAWSYFVTYEFITMMGR